MTADTNNRRSTVLADLVQWAITLVGVLVLMVAASAIFKWATEEPDPLPLYLLTPYPYGIAWEVERIESIPQECPGQFQQVVRVGEALVVIAPAQAPREWPMAGAPTRVDSRAPGNVTWCPCTDAENRTLCSEVYFSPSGASWCLDAD